MWDPVPKSCVRVPNLSLVYAIPFGTRMMCRSQVYLEQVAAEPGAEVPTQTEQRDAPLERERQAARKW